jgi:hypothetical protein
LELGLVRDRYMYGSGLARGYLSGLESGSAEPHRGPSL